MKELLTKGAGIKFSRGGGKHKNISGGWVIGNIFQEFFFVGTSLFLNTFRKKNSEK
jgi:hypothetical protein